MIWILIVWIHVGYGTAMTTVEFSDKTACTQAKEAVVKSVGRYQDAWAMCTPKGGQQQ
jgi:hypothetical protein